MFGHKYVQSKFLMLSRRPNQRVRENDGRGSENPPHFYQNFDIVFDARFTTVRETTCED